MKELKEISLKDLSFNPMTLISDGWMLIAAGTEKTGANAMTACWGSVGALWGSGHGLPVTTVYVRPQRYTKEFLDREELYSLCFFPAGYKKALAYMGSHSGREGDKTAKAGLTEKFADGFTYFAEADLVIVCRKLYCAPLVEEGFIDRKIMEDNYPERDFHYVYTGEIIKVLASGNEYLKG